MNTTKSNIRSTPRILWNIIIQAIWWRFQPVTNPRPKQGFSEEVDSVRLDSIRRRLDRGQHFITRPDARFLIDIIDGRIKL